MFCETRMLAACIWYAEAKDARPKKPVLVHAVSWLGNMQVASIKPHETVSGFGGGL